MAGKQELSEGILRVALSPLDRTLLQNCLQRQPNAWEQFVDRFLGLVSHVIHHTARSRSLRLTPQDFEDLCSEVFLSLLRDDFALLRRFRGESSLATYLTVIARRIVVRELLQRKVHASLGEVAEQAASGGNPIERITNREEIERLMQGLTGSEAVVVRLFHLEGKSYEEISSAVGMPTNSVGPTLSRAREKMRSLFSSS